MAAKDGFKIAEEIRWCGEGLCSWHHLSGPCSSSWAVFASSLQPCFLNRREKQQPACQVSLPLLSLINSHHLATHSVNGSEPSDKHPCVLNQAPPAQEVGGCRRERSGKRRALDELHQVAGTQELNTLDVSSLHLPGAVSISWPLCV